MKIWRNTISENAQTFDDVVWMFRDECIEQFHIHSFNIAGDNDGVFLCFAISIEQYILIEFDTIHEGVFFVAALSRKLKRYVRHHQFRTFR